MKAIETIITTANNIVAEIAHKTNEVCPVYPITPASNMAELCEALTAQGRQNIFGSVPETISMQSEAGVAGTMHGALQTGSLCTTFTASQGLLLMIPNMYKIAGGLFPNVIHVATRSIATHALSIFGDHSDIMAVRNTGYAMLGAASVQEAQDFALIAQAATLSASIPFVHFFDGFRTSHESANITALSDSVINAMIDRRIVAAHKKRALNPNNPVIRGTAQASDIFFQSREAINPFYDNCPEIVQQKMDNFALLTGRQYKIFEYVGHPQAEQLIITMASSCETVEETVSYLNSRGGRLGLIKVRLYRPFSAKHLLAALPKSCRSIAVLDRTKEPGAGGEPLYLDVVQTITEAFQNRKINYLPRIIGGRYGLASKEFSPGMVNAIVENLKSPNPKNNFTVGIYDDVKNTSLNSENPFEIGKDYEEAIFYEFKSNRSQEQFEKMMKFCMSKEKSFIQGYSEIDYKKSNSRFVSHFRHHTQPIKAPYLVQKASFIYLQSDDFLHNDNAVDRLKFGGMILVNTRLDAACFWALLPAELQYRIVEKEIDLRIVNIDEICKDQLEVFGDIDAKHACYFSLNKHFKKLADFNAIRFFIHSVNTKFCSTLDEIGRNFNEKIDDSLMGMLSQGNGYSLPVSFLPVDGTFQTSETNFESEKSFHMIPGWDPDLCTQCGACSLACSQSALRVKVYEESLVKKAPSGFKTAPSRDFDLLNYTIQINNEKCTSCMTCLEACNEGALTIEDSINTKDLNKSNWEHINNIPELGRGIIDTTKLRQQQLQQPLFNYPSAIGGCGEAAYLKLLSQLFGDRMLVANATGTSSILGGGLPNIPWGKNIDGRGPAWANSLFEDNAEFGLGFRLSLDSQRKEAIKILKGLTGIVDFELICAIINSEQTTDEEISNQRKRVARLNSDLKKLATYESEKLLEISDALIKKTVWIVGGDGWAYDIGFGGIDHVIASGANVNILILDNELYDNTGGQMSKATPLGATSKLAINGKVRMKKDLGLMAMTYEDVYIASISLGADTDQALKAFNEAESYEGPSIIIAYTHSESHGIDMKNPVKYHKAAVDSGQWILYRHDPRRVQNGDNPLILDSIPPSIKLADYLKMEGRFSNLFNESDASKLKLKNLQKQVDKRFKKYKSLALGAKQMNQNLNGSS